MCVRFVDIAQGNNVAIQRIHAEIGVTVRAHDAGTAGYTAIGFRLRPRDGVPGVVMPSPPRCVDAIARAVNYRGNRAFSLITPAFRMSSSTKKQGTRPFSIWPRSTCRIYRQ